MDEFIVAAHGPFVIDSIPLGCALIGGEQHTPVDVDRDVVSVGRLTVGTATDGLGRSAPNRRKEFEPHMRARTKLQYVLLIVAAIRAAQVLISHHRCVVRRGEISRSLPPVAAQQSSVIASLPASFSSKDASTIDQLGIRRGVFATTATQVSFVVELHDVLVIVSDVRAAERLATACN